MENASKALIMAGGILIALLVLGALLLMFNELSAYQRSNSDMEKISQLSSFNYQFTQFARRDLDGVDLISLSNKVVDYNFRTSGYGEINYNEKITINITLTSSFQTKFGDTLSKFYIGNYTVNSATDDFYKICNEFRKYEEKYTLDALSLLVSNYSSLEDGTRTVEELLGQSFQSWEGKDLSQDEILKVIREYSEFTLLKTSTFSIVGEPQYYPDGQIKSMNFQYLK